MHVIGAFFGEWFARQESISKQTLLDALRRDPKADMTEEQVAASIFAWVGSEEKDLEDGWTGDSGRSED